MNKKTAFLSVSSLAELPKLLTAFVTSRSDEGDPIIAEIEHMQESDTSQTTRGDVHDLHREMTVADPFLASFGDPLPLTIIEAGDEADEHYMPDPLAAQADCGGVIETIFDLLTDTRLDPLAPEIAWGFVNSFHFVAGKLERREDHLADTLRDMARRLEPGEVFNRELEQTQLECQSVAEQRAAIEAMRDYAAAMYRACSGRAWAPARGSKASHVTTASQISVLDFLRARAEKRQDRHDPQGPIVVVSGPAQWHDYLLIWNRLDEIKARIPHMVVITTGQDTGVDACARTWAAKNGIPCIGFDLRGNRYGTGRNKGFRRNKHINSLKPVEAILCQGSGIQEDLYDLFNPKDGRRVPTHVFYFDDQASMPPIERPRRRRMGGRPLQPTR